MSRLLFSVKHSKSSNQGSVSILNQQTLLWVPGMDSSSASWILITRRSINHLSCFIQIFLPIGKQISKYFPMFFVIVTVTSYYCLNCCYCLHQICDWPVCTAMFFSSWKQGFILDEPFHHIRTSIHSFKTLVWQSSKLTFGHAFQ